jgi:hypothetical protein
MAMLLDESKIKLLLEALVLTHETEVDCDECFDAMAEFAESQLSGASVPQALVLIDDHIRICADCNEEFEILKKTISKLDDDLGIAKKKWGH